MRLNPIGEIFSPFGAPDLSIIRVKRRKTVVCWPSSITWFRKSRKTNMASVLMTELVAGKESG